MIKEKYMKIFRKAAAALIFAAAAPALVCFAGQQEIEAEKDIFAMDTFMTLKAAGEKAQEAVDAASSEILRLDAMLSTGNENSMVYKLNQAGSGEASEEMETLFAYSEDLYEDTGGRFDITIYPVMELWGFTSGEYHVPSPEELEQAKQLLGMEQVKLDEDADVISLGKEGMKIDFGGIAKGYASSRVMDIFEEYGVICGIVNLGGNVHTYKAKADGSNWRIGIRDPLDPDTYLGIVEVADEAVITSGGYERYFEQDGQTYHHIMDPDTCRPADSGLASVSIISGDGTLADGLSTSLFIMGREEAEDYWRDHPGEFETILVGSDGAIAVTEGLEDRFTSENDFEVIRK